MSRVRLNVEFDKHAWASMTEGERSDWVDQVWDAVQEHARVTCVEWIGED